jgi:CheY-like chemotaxis protein
MKTILVVDDEFDMAGTLRAILEGEGYRVETCGDGHQAIERVRSSRPDLILMDVMMPVMSGFEALQAMRDTPGLDSVPVELMSAVAPGVKREGYEWQAFLSKPFSLEGLVGAVVRLIVGAGPGPSGR